MNTNSNVPAPFKLDESFIAQYAHKQPAWGYGVLSYVVYKRTYARELPNGDTEEYWQTVQRVVEGVFQLQQKYLPASALLPPEEMQRTAQRMYRYMWAFKFLPPGRGLWSMGSPIVMERGNGAALYNCAFRSTKDIDKDFAAPFCFLLEASAVGVGVGFDTRGEGKVNIVEPEFATEVHEATPPKLPWYKRLFRRQRALRYRLPSVHTIEDSREGWSVALRLVLGAYVGRNALPSFDYSKVRPFGAPIKTFGGTASGPEALRELLERDIPEILGTPGPITSSQIVDLMNAIGKCVVAGGARRSAEIALGRHDDEAFIALKTDMDKLMRWRWASNNSIIAPRTLDLAAYQKFAELITAEPGGEPGFVWIDNCREFGRFADGYRGDDFGILGMNPCSEIGLEDGELCNVVETFMVNCADLAEFIEVCKLAHMYAKTVSLVPTPWELTNDKISRNRRIGVSLSGIVQNIEKRGEPQHFIWCDAAYKALRTFDNELSDGWKVARSIRLTTIKPSGTVSLLVGASPGIHYPHSEFIIRRVNFPKGSKWSEILMNAGYDAEPNAYEAASETGAKSMVVSFPIHEQNFSKGKAHVSLREQMELCAKHQYWWADNAISITVTVQAHEYAELPKVIAEYSGRLKTVSFLPLRDASYVQAPYEEISQVRYDDAVAKLKPLPQFETLNVVHEVTERFCDGETCTLSFQK